MSAPTARNRIEHDAVLGAAILIAGTGSLVLGLARAPNALSMVPAMDGCLVAGAVSLALALLAGVPYRMTLALLAPLVLIQLVGCRVHHASPFAVLGLEAVIVGAVGCVVGLSRRRHHRGDWARSRGARPW